MLVWINGAHGAGKTSVAARLASMLPGTAIVDPEQIGFMLRRVWPGAMPSDFKDLPVWRTLTLATLDTAAKADPASILLVPMTLSKPDHFDEIIGGLQAAGVDVRHFTLLAERDTLRRRLRWRPDWPRSRRWALAEAERCGSALHDSRFAVHVPTDGRRVKDIAEDLLERLRPAAPGRP